MTFAGAAPLVLLLLGASIVRRGGRAGRIAGFVSIGAAFATISVLALLGTTARTGTFDTDPFSLFLGCWLIVELAVTFAVGQGNPSRLFLTAAALLLSVSSRNLLWIYVGFEASSLVTLRLRPRSIGSSGVALLGLVLLAVSGNGTDLAALEPETWPTIGLLLFIAGIVAKWLFASAEIGFESLGAGIALVALCMRVQAWVPELAFLWVPLGALFILAGSLGSALAGRTSVFLWWLALSQVGVAVIGISGGAPSLPHVLMHVAASTLSILLLALSVDGEDSRSAVAVWILALSVASFPPLPGFVTKIGLLAPLPGEVLSLALVGGFLVGIGCARLVTRTAGARKDPAATLAAVVVALALGILPDTIFRLAMLAAAGLF